MFFDTSERFAVMYYQCHCEQEEHSMSLISKKEGLKGERVIRGGINEDYCTMECIKNYRRENYAVPSFQLHQF